MLVKESLIDTIISFIANRKAEKLKKAFIKSPTIVKSIQDMWDSYDRMQRNIDSYCKKFPDACRDAEALQKKYRIK